jgi:hypothetical protein
MKFKTVFIFAFVLLMLPSVVFAKICVLSLFEKTTQDAKKVLSVFEFYDKADIFQEATLDQIKYCFSSDEYDEILWLSHGLNSHQSHTSYSAPIWVKRNESNNVEKVTLPKRFFQTLLSLSPAGRLKKVRVALCEVNVEMANLDRSIHGPVTSTIEILLRGLHQNGVVIEFSPQFLSSSLFNGKYVTQLKESWLSKSLEWEDVLRFERWKTNNNSRCEKDSWSGCERVPGQHDYIIPLSEES